MATALATVHPIRNTDIDYDLNETRKLVLTDFLADNAEALMDRLTKFGYVAYQLRKLGSSEDEIKRALGGADVYALIEPLSRIDNDETG